MGFSGQDPCFPTQKNVLELRSHENNETARHFDGAGSNPPTLGIVVFVANTCDNRSTCDGEGGRQGRGREGRARKYHQPRILPRGGTGQSGVQQCAAVPMRARI